jgi:hypothetical protein
MGSVGLSGNVTGRLARERFCVGVTRGKKDHLGETASIALTRLAGLYPLHPKAPSRQSARDNTSNMQRNMYTPHCRSRREVHLTTITTIC